MRRGIAKEPERDSRSGPKRTAGWLNGPDSGLATRAAWLHFVGGHSQSDVADMLSLNRVKVNRLIAQAQREGRVKTFVEGGVDRCIRLEQEICERFGLQRSTVVPNVSAMDPPLDVLGVAGAQLLLRLIEKPDIRLVGLGTGRTLSAMARALPELDRKDLDFVSLLGTFRRSTVLDPYDVVNVLAGKVAGRCFTMPVPFVVDTAETRQLLLSQAFIRSILELQCRADINFIGIGSVDPRAHLVSIGILTAADMQDAKALGGVAEFAGHFFDADGKEVQSPIRDRVIGQELAALRRSKTVLIAGGNRKVAAISAALKTGACWHLITDEGTAKQLV